MVELVFVIVILGILAGVAIPKMGSITDMFEEDAVRQNAIALQSVIATMKNECIMKSDIDIYKTSHSITLAATTCKPDTLDSLKKVIDNKMPDLDTDQKTKLKDALDKGTDISYNKDTGKLTVK